MKPHPVRFTCKVVRYSTDLQPIVAMFEVFFSDGVLGEFTRYGTRDIEEARGELTRKLAEIARSIR